MKSQETIIKTYCTFIIGLFCRLLDIIERFLSNVKWLKDNITLVKSNVEVEVRHITWIDHESGTYYEPHVSTLHWSYIRTSLRRSHSKNSTMQK